MTKGLDAILSNLTKLQVKAPNAAREAVTEVAEEFEKQLQANTPVDEKFIDHLQDDTVVSGFKGASEGIISKDIGYGKSTGWRAKYPDSGTIYQRGQNFEEKTINQMTPRAKYIYAKKIKGGLGL
ncbi:HK97-gp10 family putative phage morphogenesis protein [Streptococcus gallolyticus]|uniref:HK97-gp10 family putative phage morphogenesis protein n=1 Tax=Streptococcus gallolyticus TaxID=315405 RepID=UPI0022846C7F|nr:HK97-gp10 family putative phage morphogenesis protein [Streptococcus gallolyticus]MCY7193377.1 HK97 gp10 family phage protein [Streptococcus gallolyticus subsp. gallolyticus]